MATRRTSRRSSPSPFHRLPCPTRRTCTARSRPRRPDRMARSHTAHGQPHRSQTQPKAPRTSDSTIGVVGPPARSLNRLVPPGISSDYDSSVGVARQRRRNRIGIGGVRPEKTLSGGPARWGRPRRVGAEEGGIGARLGSMHLCCSRRIRVMFVEIHHQFAAIEKRAYAVRLNGIAIRKNL